MSSPFRVTYQDRMLALVLPCQYRPRGTEFYTDPDHSLQLGSMCLVKNQTIPPHTHLPVERLISYTQEVLFIKRGRVRVDFFDHERTFLKSIELSQGDVILLLESAGHGFEALEELEMIEVKQGPYAGQKDKVRFEAKS